VYKINLALGRRKKLWQKFGEYTMTGQNYGFIKYLGGFVMKAIVTVLGKDKVGIIAKVCVYLAERNVNVLEISQTILEGYFNMIMIIDITRTTCPLTELADGLEKLGDQIGVVIKFQREEIFESMHRI
jgi:ACT domain-containing protein